MRNTIENVLQSPVDDLGVLKMCGCKIRLGDNLFYFLELHLPRFLGYILVCISCSFLELRTLRLVEESLVPSRLKCPGSIPKSAGVRGSAPRGISGALRALGAGVSRECPRSVKRCPGHSRDTRGTCWRLQSSSRARETPVTGWSSQIWSFLESVSRDLGGAWCFHELWNRAFKQNSGKKKAHKHQSFWPVTPPMRGESPGQVSRGQRFMCYHRNPRNTEFFARVSDWVDW